MTYQRLRIAVLLIAALVVMASPAFADRSPDGQSAGDVSAAGVRARLALSPPPSASASGGADAPGASGGADAPASSPTGSPGVKGGEGSSHPSHSATIPHGPAGSLTRTGSSSVALTFDDGPDPDNTPKFLDLLKEHGVRATFCLVGSKARDYPDIVRRIAAEGHDFCNHSWQHLLDLGKRQPDYIRDDLSQTNAAIRAAVPNAKIKTFRAPGGNFTPSLVGVARDLGMSSIYWDVDPRDWDHKGTTSDQGHVDRVVAAVQRDTRPGSIVLSHDSRQPTTTAAYRTLLPWLKGRFTLSLLPDGRSSG